MAVENLQGELQRVTRTIDLQESLVNGCAGEFAGRHVMMKSPQISAGQSLIKNISRESSAANHQPRIQAKDANSIQFVFIRANSRLNLGFSYLLPSEGIAGHAPIAIVAVRTGTTSCVKGIKRSQELRRMKEEERGRRHVQRSQGYRLGIQRVRMKVGPMARVQASDQVFQGGNGLCRSKRAVSGAMHEDLTEEPLVAGLAHHVTISAFILVRDQAITFSVHGEHGEVDISVEDDVLFKIVHRVGIGGDARGLVQGFQIVFQAEPRLFVKSANFRAVDGVFELFPVVNAGIP
jgi:hypothetical protein